MQRFYYFTYSTENLQIECFFSFLQNVHVQKISRVIEVFRARACPKVLKVTSQFCFNMKHVLLQLITMWKNMKTKHKTMVSLCIG